MKVKALITDASYLNTLAIVRYLGKEGIGIHILGNNNNLSISRYSKYCNGYYNGPDIEDERDYMRFILKILEKEKINILIPVSYKATSIAAKYKDEINKVSKVEVADYDKVQIALNKRSTYELAKRIGVPCPKTFYPKTMKELEKMGDEISYPAVIKWIFEVGHNIVAIAENKSELFKKYKDICKKYKPITEFLPMIQEFIEADKEQVYCISALYQGGKCKRIFMQKQIRNIPVRGGTCSYAQSCYFQEIKNYSLKLLDYLDWHGVANIEFKLDRRDNLFKLMEINPKFWASTDMALRAGVNFPLLLCQMSEGNELEYSEKYDRDLKFNFPFSRELKHIVEKPSSIFKIMLDNLNPKVKSNVWLYDFKPNLVELLVCLGSIIVPGRIKLAIRNLVNKKNARQYQDINTIR
jgi:predicted ATP-grasp superfamily ATP-dependent carboligase